MTILQVLPALEMGGVERGTIEIASALQAAGIRNFVASAGGRLVPGLERIGVEHFTLPAASKNPFVIRRNAARLAAFAREKGVTLMHVRSRAPAWSVLWASRRTGIPFLSTFHGVYGTSPAFPKKNYNAVMLKGVKVIAVSDFVKRHILETYSVPESRIVRIHRGADTEVFKPVPQPVSGGKPVVTLVGRLTRWKGQLLLLDALAKLARPVRCLLVGSDQGRTAYTAELNARAATLPPGIEVEIRQEAPDMPAVYAASDVVVNASLDPEAFGRVIPEAQACGRVAVGAAHGGACETIDDGRTGFLFKPGDAGDLAAKLAVALDLPAASRETMCAAAAVSVQEHFSVARMCSETLALYQRLEEHHG